jgi:hypothetical protein
MAKTRAKTIREAPPVSQAPPRRFPRLEQLLDSRLALILLFCLALALRVWGLSFGLPSYFSVDEINKREAALSLADTNFRHRTSQPSFLYNSLYVVFTFGRLLNPDLTAVQYHYLGRFWMALLGSLTVVVLYRLGSVWDRRLGLLAGLFLAVLPLHSATSRYIKEDTPLALMTTLTVLLVVLYLKNPSRKTLALAALFGGISFSTKYSGLLMVVPVALGLAASSRRSRRALPATLMDALIVVVAFWAGFFLVSPVYLLEPREFLAGFLGQWTYSKAGHHDGIVHNPWHDWWVYYARTGLIPGMTWPLFVLSIAGLVLMARSRDGWIITATVVWLYLVFEHGRAKPYPFSARYILPLAPLLCLSAATAMVGLASSLKQRLPASAAYALCAALFVLPPLVKSALVADEALHDTRIVAGAWMEQAIPTDSDIVVSDSPSNLPVSDFWGREWRVYTPERLRELYGGRRESVPPYFVFSSFSAERYLESPDAVPQWTRYYVRIMEGYRLVKEFRPRWLTYGFHSPVIRIYQPPAPPDALSSNARGFARREG